MEPARPNPQDVADVRECRHCEHAPCLLLQGLYLEVAERAETLQNDEACAHLTNKQIRFILYRLATNWIHGFLGKGNRIKLPVCVRGEILDIAPEPDHVYVGFRPSRMTNEADAT